MIVSKKYEIYLVCVSNVQCWWEFKLDCTIWFYLKILLLVFDMWNRQDNCLLILLFWGMISQRYSWELWWDIQDGHNSLTGYTCTLYESLPGLFLVYLFPSAITYVRWLKLPLSCVHFYWLYSMLTLLFERLNFVLRVVWFTIFVHAESQFTNLLFVLLYERGMTIEWDHCIQFGTDRLITCP